jgi:long-chain acyl-CoA synthetase
LEKHVYSEFKARFGKVNTFVLGGGPISEFDAALFMLMGFKIYMGYGTTQTSPIISGGLLKPGYLDAAGKPIKDVDVQIAQDGEILVRGPNVMQGYHKDPAATAEALQDGYFHTGDIGYLRNGHLVITDRKSNHFKLADADKWVNPTPIELVFEESSRPWVDQVVLYGAGWEKLGAIIGPNFTTLEAWARQHKIHYSSREELVRHPEVVKLYSTLPEKYNNGHRTLPDGEVLPHIAAIQVVSGLEEYLTTTQKMQREQVSKNLYADIQTLKEKVHTQKK